MSDVVIHRLASIHTEAAPYLPYSDEQIAIKRAAAEQECQFDYVSFMPSVYTPKHADKDTIRKMIDKMIETKNYSIPYHSKEFHIIPNRTELYHVYVAAVKLDHLPRDYELEKSLRTFKGRSDSGVLVFTLVMSDMPNGAKFTCKYDCSYCPNVPNMARSYIPAEPAVARGDQFNWDPIAQIFNRFKSYLATGQIDILPKDHVPPTIKGEFILEGGTFSNYPDSYCDWFMTMLYYACNVIYDTLPRRKPFTLEEEQRINISCVGIRVVGLSIETRPDMINAKLLKRLRTYGVTRVQIGVQHTDDEILRGVNRLCYDRHTRAAMRLLADNAFKIQIHLMPDLPGSSPEIDIAMFEKIFTDLDYVYDCIKCYPTMVVNFTKIKELYDAKLYKPYGDDINVMFSVLIRMTELLNKNNLTRVRFERVVRDIPSKDIEGGTNETNLGDILAIKCKKLGISCCCIRCREVRSRPMLSKPVLVRSDRMAAGANEIFLSMEADNILYGFLRLRLAEPYGKCVFDELHGAALIREVHVYGTSAAVGSTDTHVQSHGFGSILVKEAKSIARIAGYKKIAVISGNGVKNYYIVKHAFVDTGNYLVCEL